MKRIRVALVGPVDHGKSTLIGRLLADTGDTREERIARIESFCESRGKKFEFAFLLDALEEEQAKGITLDVTEVNWSYGGQDFIFVDTPGHREFLKKMVGGASRVEAAVLMVDVREALPDSFRRQLLVLDLLGVKKQIILVNKMDLVDWSEEAWKARESEVRALTDTSVRIIPVAAWHGANLLVRAREMPWYQGPCFVDALAELPAGTEKNTLATRFFVQDTYSFDGKKIFAGRVESGEVKVGQELCFHPGNKRATVRGIEVFEERRERAQSGDAIGLTFQEDLEMPRGSFGYAEADAPQISTRIVGDLFWLDPAPLRVGEHLKMRTGTRTASVQVEKIEHEVDGDSFVKSESTGKISLFGRVQFRFAEPWAFDRFEDCEPTGRFVVSREHLVLGGGRWVEAKTEGRVLWFTGYSGAGKTTLARTFEAELRAKGEKAIVIDGDELRKGLCRDLGFSPADRKENLRRAAELAKFLASAGFTVITAFISPLAEHRNFAKAVIGQDRFREVFVDCPLEVCERRDVKGLYAKARKGEIPEFTGISAPYEVPIKPDIYLRTDLGGIEASLAPLRWELSL